MQNIQVRILDKRIGTEYPLPEYATDGAAGMVRLRQAGGQTVAQNEESCVVFGMPREAIRQGGAQEVLALDHMPARIDRYASGVALPAPAPALAR